MISKSSIVRISITNHINAVLDRLDVIMTRIRRKNDVYYVNGVKLLVLSAF